MNIDKIIRWILFSAGIMTGITAGILYSAGREASGASCLAITVGFLCFATRFGKDDNVIYKYKSNKNNFGNDDLHDIAILMAEMSVSIMKNAGRTILPSVKEIENLENRINNFLDNMPVSDAERKNIEYEFDRLRERTRRNEGGRAIIRNSRL